jgi:hypothetical protein
LEAGLPVSGLSFKTGSVGRRGPVESHSGSGQVSEQVECRPTRFVETRSVGVGQVVENARILELPLNGRNVQDQAHRNGGIGRASRRAAEVTVFDQRRLAFGTTTPDGAKPEFAIGSTMTMPFPDATQ